MNFVPRVAPAFALGVVLASAPALAQDLRIGMLLPQSGGPFIQVGADLSDGFQLAIEEANGQVAGRKIQVLREDTTHKPDVAQAKARKFVFENKVDMLVGPIAATEITALADFANQSKMPLIVPNSGDNSVTGAKCSPWLLRTSFSNDQIVRNMGPWMVKQGYKRVAVIAIDLPRPRDKAIRRDPAFFAYEDRIRTLIMEEGASVE